MKKNVLLSLLVLVLIACSENENLNTQLTANDKQMDLKNINLIDIYLLLPNEPYFSGELISEYTKEEKLQGLEFINADSTFLIGGNPSGPKFNLYDLGDSYYHIEREVDPGSMFESITTFFKVNSNDEVIKINSNDISDEKLTLLHRIISESSNGDNLKIAEWQKQYSAGSLDWNIETYFNLLPSVLLNCINQITDIENKLEDRTSKITYLNKAKGFLKSKEIQVALFKDKKSNKDYIALSSGQLDTENECDHSIAFLHFDQSLNKWNFCLDIIPSDDEINEVFEAHENSFNQDFALVYELPENGLEIKVYDNLNDLVMKWKWNGEEFMISK